jgi:hypothetical protein
MKKQLCAAGLALVIAVAAYVRGAQLSAASSPMNCNLSAYQGVSGLNASANGDSLVLTWDGDRNQELRLRFVIDNGTPTIADLAARKKGGAWGSSLIQQEVVAKTDQNSVAYKYDAGLKGLSTADSKVTCSP